MVRNELGMKGFFESLIPEEAPALVPDEAPVSADLTIRVDWETILLMNAAQERETHIRFTNPLPADVVSGAQAWVVETLAAAIEKETS